MGNSTLAVHLMLLVVITVLITSATSSLPSSRESGRFKIYQLVLEHGDQLKRLLELEKDGTVDIWRHPSPSNLTSDMMINEWSEGGRRFRAFLTKFNVTQRVLVDDVDSFLAKVEGPLDEGRKWDEKSDGSLRIANAIRGRRQHNDFGFPAGRYYTYDEMVELMQRVRSFLPTHTQIRSIGQSTEGRSIQGIEFGEPGNLAKKVVWIDAGIHAREWTSVHSALYFINHIANDMLSGGTGKLSLYLQKFNIIIFPCVNPDGYEYTRSNSRSADVRFWRKNRSKPRCQGELCCPGTDLNRNFDFRFAQAGTSHHPCSEIYHGSVPFSEPETRAIRDGMQNLRGRLMAYITMHAYAQLWIYPFSDQQQSYPPDVADLRAVAQRAVNAVEGRSGSSWKYGTGPEVIYAYSGGSADWAKQVLGVKYTYTIELRPSYQTWNGFMLDSSQLVPAAQEAWDGIMVVLEAVASTVPNLAPRVAAATVVSVPTTLEEGEEV